MMPPIDAGKASFSDLLLNHETADGHSITRPRPPRGRRGGERESRHGAYQGLTIESLRMTLDAGGYQVRWGYNVAVIAFCMYVEGR